MKVDTEALVEHLKLVSMNGRISEIAFGEELAVELVDTDQEIVVRGKSKIAMTEGFALSDVMDFRKIVKAFKGEIELEVGPKIKITTEQGVINYQTADAAIIESTLKSFDAIVKANFSDPIIISGVPGESLENLRRFLKLLTPDLVELSAVRKGENWWLEAKLINADGHDGVVSLSEADVPAELQPDETTLAEAETSELRTQPMKVSAKAVQDVIDGIELGHGEPLLLGVCGALRIQYGDYEFIISKQIEV